MKGKGGGEEKREKERKKEKGEGEEERECIGGREMEGQERLVVKLQSSKTLLLL